MSLKWSCQFCEMHCTLVSINSMYSVLMCACACPHTLVCVSVCGGQRSTSHVLFFVFPPHFWDKVSHWAWNTEWLSEPEESSRLPPRGCRWMPPCQAFTWMLGIRTQVLLHGHQATWAISPAHALDIYSLLSFNLLFLFKRCTRRDKWTRTVAVAAADGEEVWGYTLGWSSCTYVPCLAGRCWWGTRWVIELLGL